MSNEESGKWFLNFAGVGFCDSESTQARPAGLPSYAHGGNGAEPIRRNRMCLGRAAYCFAMIGIAEARPSVNDAAGMTHLSIPTRLAFSAAPAWPPRCWRFRAAASAITLCDTYAFGRH